MGHTCGRWSRRRVTAWVTGMARWEYCLLCVPGREGRKAVDLVTVTLWLAILSYECRSVTPSDASVTNVNIEVGGALPARIVDSPSTCWTNGRETARALVT